MLREHPAANDGFATAASDEAAASESPHRRMVPALGLLPENAARNLPAADGLATAAQDRAAASSTPAAGPPHSRAARARPNVARSIQAGDESVARAGYAATAARNSGAMRGASRGREQGRAPLAHVVQSAPGENESLSVFSMLDTAFLSAGLAAPAPARAVAPARPVAGEAAAPKVNMKAVATTQPHQLDFTSSAQGVFGVNTSFSFSLPSFLFQHFDFSIGTSVAGFGFHAGVSITGGVKGSVNLGLGSYTPDYPITIDPKVVPFVQDGQVFSIDPTLVSTDDAHFALSLPHLSASLDFGLQASAGATLSLPGIPIGVSLPFIGFVGTIIHVPDVSVGTTVGGLFHLPANSTISIPGDGTITLSELQAHTLTSAGASAYEGLPTLELSGNTDPFFVANTDLVSILATEVPDPFAVLQGSQSLADGLAGFSYKLLSLPLSGTLWLHEDVTLTPIAITETVTDELTGDTQSGTLGQSFNFTAPASGNGTIPLQITYGLELSVHTVLELDGAIKLTVEGPSVSASVLGISAGFGPLGNFNLLDMSGTLFDIYSNTSTQTISVTDVVDVQNFGTSVTQTISGKSAGVSITKPATNVAVTATGKVTGGTFGVKTGTLSTAMVTNAGLITATGNGVYLQAGGTVDVQAGAHITGKGTAPGTGILMVNNPTGSVTNEGTISGFAQGVNLLAGSVKNLTGGVISATGAGIAIASNSASIVNNGAINGSTGITLSHGGSVYNAVAGTITGGNYGVYAAGALVLENHCTLTAANQGIHATAGGTVTNLAGALIHGGAVGVVGDGGAADSFTLVNNLDATISGAKIGVTLNGLNTSLTNQGTISGSIAGIQLYGSQTNTLVLDPRGAVLGGVRMQNGAQNIVELMAAPGAIGTLAGLGTVLPLSAQIEIDQAAAWRVSGDFSAVTVGGLNQADVLNDTAIAFTAGERVVFDNANDALSIRAAGNATTVLGTIQLAGNAPITYGFVVSADAGGGIDLALATQKLTSVTANNGEVFIGPAGNFADTVTVSAGVTVSSTYYGASLPQFYGVLASNTRATLTNLGTILASQTAVDLLSGGVLINGAGGVIAGNIGVLLGNNSIDSFNQVAVNNAGSISGSAGAVYFSSLGTLTNATGAHITSARLNAVQFSAGGTVMNAGVMAGGRSAVRMLAGGFVYNETGGSLTGSLGGVQISGGYGRVVNCGTITATGGAGVYLGAGGLLINESGTIRGGTLGVLISGGAGNVANAANIAGIVLSNGGTIINAATGTISAAGSYAVSFYNMAGPVAAYLHNMGRVGGVLAFGGDRIANDGLINGLGIVGGAAGAGTLAITNSGTVSGSTHGMMVAGYASVTNAAGGVITGLGTNGTGIAASGGGTVTNAGTISGGGFGVVLDGAVTALTNSGKISGGQSGVVLGGTVTVLTNAGTISAGGAAVILEGTVSNTLILDSGDVLKGAVVAQSGASNSITLAAGTGTGTLAGFGTSVMNFNQVAIATGAAWVINATALQAAATVFSGAAAIDTLNLTGGGALTKGLSGFGTLGLAGGAFTVSAQTMPAVKHLLLQAGAKLTGGATIGAALSGSGTLAAAAGKVMKLTGGFSFGGTLSGNGTFVLASAGTLNAGSAITARTEQQANLTLGAGENLTLGNIAYSVQTASAAQTLQITGASGDSLSNAGTLAATGPGAVRIGTVVSNTGLIAANAGTLTLLGAITNSGTLTAAGGTLILAQQALGTGALSVGAASTLWLQAGAAAGETAQFLATTGTLELSSPANFLGGIAGFGGGDAIDLVNIAATGLAFSNGTLTVSAGTTAVAHLRLSGSYTPSNFTLASDGHGGTQILFHT